MLRNFLTTFCNNYSFVPFSYKLGLVRTLVDRVFKINNAWTGFHLDISNLTKTLRKTLFPSSATENVLRKFLNNYFTPIPLTTKRRIKKLVNTFAVTWKLSWCSPRLKLGVGLGRRILSLRVYDRESFTSFHVQAVRPVILVKPIDTSPLASVNISPPTNIPTYLST